MAAFIRDLVLSVISNIDTDIKLHMHPEIRRYKEYWLLFILFRGNYIEERVNGIALLDTFKFSAWKRHLNCSFNEAQ